MSDQPLLVVADVHGFYGTAHVLEGVNFSMGAEPVALIGRNGMGKSTLCAAIVGLLGSATGSVRLDGEEILGKPAYKIASAGIGYMTMNAREFLQTDVVVLGIIIYALLGKLADSLTRAVEVRSLAWHPAYQNHGDGATA